MLRLRESIQPYSVDSVGYLSRHRQPNEAVTGEQARTENFVSSLGKAKSVINHAYNNENHRRCLVQ